MTDATLAAVTASVASPLRPWYLLAAGAAFAVMFVAILGPSDWFLNWVHVMSGTLWTGIDLFIGIRGRAGVAPSVASRTPRRDRRHHSAHAYPDADALHHYQHRRLVPRRPHGLSQGRLSGILVGSSCTRHRCDAHRAGHRHPTADQRSPLFRNIENRPRHRQDWTLDANLCARGGHARRNAGRDHRGHGALCHGTLNLRTFDLTNE